MHTFAISVDAKEPVKWMSTGDMLVIRSMVLLQGDRAVVRAIGASMSEETVLAVLTPVSPNFACDLPFMECASFSVSGGHGCKVYINGFEEPIEESSEEEDEAGCMMEECPHEHGDCSCGESTSDDGEDDDQVPELILEGEIEEDGSSEEEDDSFKIEEVEMSESDRRGPAKNAIADITPEEKQSDTPAETVAPAKKTKKQKRMEAKAASAEQAAPKKKPVEHGASNEKNSAAETSASSSSPSPSPQLKKSFPSGLRYEILKVGSNKGLATRGKGVTVQYYGTLASGKKFDSGTFKFTVGAGEVVPGFDKGVEGMMVGEKRRIFIPAKLGYGKKGAGKSIPPNSNLVFEITLVKVH